MNNEPHNLTSDAEGEEEMLYVSRKRVQEIFVNAQKAAPSCEYDRGFRGAELTILRNLFGSKCLPDEEQSAKSAHCSEPKPAEPKFKVGDKVRICSRDAECYGQVGSIRHIYGNVAVYFNEHDNNRYYAPRYLEPYAEPSAGTRQEQHVPKTAESGTYPNFSQKTANCDTHSNNSLTDKKNGGVDHFVVEHDMVKEFRLTLAAQILGNIIKSEYYSLSDRYQENNIHEIAKVSMQLTDALIAEAEFTNNTE